MADFFEEIQLESKAESTKSNYARRKKQFKIWLQQCHPSCWDDENIFQLPRVTTRHICEYLANSSMKDGKMLAYSTPEANHSSIVDMYKKAKLNIPNDLNAEWLEYSKGYKNRVAENIAAGLQTTSGSDKLTFEQYRLLAGLAIKSSTFYAHGFLILAWNLMSRAGSTGNIKFEHLRWDGDHMIIVIPKHKGDRSGGKLPTEKSVYSNPVYPEICPFLTLGILLLSRENNGRIESILLGKKSEENINTWLKKTLAPEESELINQKHLTSHCTRKGIHCFFGYVFIHICFILFHFILFYSRFNVLRCWFTRSKSRDISMV